MAVTRGDIRRALRGLGLAGRAVCVHSSLRSFGRVKGGAESVVGAFMDEGCTVLVPTFSSAFEVAPPPHMRFERNGWDYDAAPTSRGSDRIYTREAADIDAYMGAVPAAVLARPDRVRGRHPLDSFTAAGPRAAELVAGQTPTDVYAPLAALVEAEGFVLLIGVGLERMTLLHMAEGEAGRTLFRRWANDERGRASAVEVGGCSEGFGRLEACLRAVERTAAVGLSRWRLFPAREALSRAAAAIRADPRITHCGAETCERCNDAVRGGPVLRAGRVRL